MQRSTAPKTRSSSAKMRVPSDGFHAEQLEPADDLFADRLPASAPPLAGRSRHVEQLEHHHTRRTYQQS